jgi:hypothetical protein
MGSLFEPSIRPSAGMIMITWGVETSTIMSIFFAYYLRDLVPQQKQRGTTSSKLLNLVFEATTLAVFVVIPLRKSEWFGIYELNSTDRTKVLLVAKPRKLYCLPRDVRFTQYHHNQGWKIDPPHWDTHEGIYSFNPSIFITPHKHP